jgi:hypothetical protein
MERLFDGFGGEIIIFILTLFVGGIATMRIIKTKQIQKGGKGSNLQQAGRDINNSSDDKK